MKKTPREKMEEKVENELKESHIDTTTYGGKMLLSSLISIITQQKKEYVEGLIGEIEEIICENCSARILHKLLKKD